MAKHLTRPGKPGDTPPKQATMALEAKAQVDYGDTCPGLKLARTWGIDYGYVLIGLDWLIHRRDNGAMSYKVIPRDWGAGLAGHSKDIFLAELRAIAKRFMDLRDGRVKL